MKVSVTVHPNAKLERVEKDLLGGLHVYVNAPPLEGRANLRCWELLAKHYEVSKSQIILLRGAKSKNKIFDIKK